jgi:pyruvate kinase
MTPLAQAILEPANAGHSAHTPIADATPEFIASKLLTSIVATIGPASDSPEMVRRLIEYGVCVFRLNFSHGDLAGHAKRLATIREQAASLGQPVAVLGDLQGPKIRVGKIPAGVGTPSPSGGGLIDVVAGQDVVFKKGIDLAFMREGIHGTEPVLPLTYQPLVDEVKLGHKVLINDGAIRMLAVDHAPNEGELRCRVTVGGKISSGKGINLPQSHLSAPAITDRDWECVAWAVANDIDYLALSFVRQAAEVYLLKQRVASMQDPRGNPAWIPVVSKIEMPQAVKNLDEIIVASDAAMVARGDLGVEMDIAKVPVVQKQIIETCAKYGKPCIVATQMLETMIENSMPTRAEASDVANAIFDGADAVMLSAETATGKHPALVVETMARIAEEAEHRIRQTNPARRPPSQLVEAHRATAALAHGAWNVAKDLDAKVVVCWSENGGTARYLSQNRFNVPVIAYSSNPASARRMALLHGVTPVCCTPPGNGTLSDWNTHVEAYLVQRGLAAAGDFVVLVAGRPLGKAKATNTIAVCRVGDPTGGYRAQEQHAR